ncbi:MAG: lauroyl acyltransferase [Pseudomonadota bacterium]|nr:lauroyl acyltransferase [Pseudomonadota bacterium]
MNDLLARVLYALTAALMRLPWSWLQTGADVVAARMLRRNTRGSKVARRNLEIAYPELLPGQREQMHRDVVQGAVRQAVETLRLWTRPHAENLQLIREHHGVEHLDAAIAAGRGAIIAAPHYGNWELLNQWISARTPLAILYAPPDSQVTDAFLKRVRTAPGGDAGRVIQIRAERAAVRQLFKHLEGGGVVGILPDQQPKQGEGEFGPFFGVPALTMPLLGRLAARTGAPVLLAYCERVDAHAGRAGPGFAVHIEPAPPAVADRDPVTAVSALNAAIEHIARRDPAQYQWTYKRYSLRPSGLGKDNPYWPDCY